MLIFLYGQDIYRSREEMRKAIEEYKKTNPDWLDFLRLDVSDKEIEILEKISQASNTISMFNQKKLIVIENIFLRQVQDKLQDELLEFLRKRELDKDREITIIFWEGENLPPLRLQGRSEQRRAEWRNNLFKFLKNKAKCQEFKPLKGHQLKSWIKDYVSKQKANVDNKAVDKLIEYIGSDLWRMTNEINKLISFKMLEVGLPTLRAGDVELLVKPEIDLNIFEMVDALGQKNRNKALKILNQFLEKREDEGYLLSMFIYQIRNLIKVKSGGKLDMHPFVIQKSRQQARNFTFEELKKIYHQLLAIDLDIKIGRIDSKAALELFLARL